MPIKPAHKPSLVVLTPTPDLPPHLDLTSYRIHHIHIPATHTPSDTSPLDSVSDDFESSQPYSILAFSHAASTALNFAVSPSRSLRSVIAYYPTTLPPQNFHPDCHVLIHLPATAPYSPAPQPNLTVRVYAGTTPNFAEDASGYDAPAAMMAWQRSLNLLRATLGPWVDLEAVVPLREVLDLAEVDDDILVEFVPIALCARGWTSVKNLYEQVWADRPLGWKWEVDRRTVGVEAVVDEVVVDFWHDREVSWCLPGVPATGRKVRFVVVVVTGVREGRVKEWRARWDRVGLWAQLGLAEGYGGLLTRAEQLAVVADGEGKDGVLEGDI